MKTPILILSVITIFSCQERLVKPNIEWDLTNKNSIGLKYIGDVLKMSEKQLSTPYKYEIVDLKLELANLFNPENFSCSIPKKIQSKIKEDGSWFPQGLNSLLTNVNPTVRKLSGQTSAVLLNTGFLISGSTESEFIAIGSPTYQNLSIEQFLDSPRNNSMYSLDCSGYLNAALSVSIKVPKIELGSQASASLDKGASIMVARAHVYSPIFMALHPKYSAGAISMTEYQRLFVLSAINGAIGNAKDDDKIYSPQEFDIIWTSNTGKSGFNGTAKFKSNVGAGLGVGSVELSADGGATFSRKSDYNDYNTYVLDTIVVSQTIQPLPVSELRKEMENLVTRSNIIGTAKYSEGKLFFTINFPQPICNLNWSVKGRTELIKSNYNENTGGCDYIFSTANTTVKLITLEFTDGGLKFEYKVPISI